MKRDWLYGEPRETVRNIVRDVARRAGLTVADIYGPARRGPIIKARHAAMYLARTQTGKSSKQIGAIFGRDHTTVLDAVRKVSEAPHRYPLIDVCIKNCGPNDNSSTDYSREVIESEGVSA